MSIFGNFPDYQHYLKITVPACTSGQTIAVGLPQLDSDIGYQFSGYVRHDAKDLRVVFNHPVNGWSEIGRTVVGAGVYFAAQQDEAAQTSDTYALVFGNASVSDSPPAGPSVSFADDFEDGVIAATWNTSTGGAASITETGGVMKVVGGAASADASLLVRNVALPAKFDLWIQFQDAQPASTANNVISIMQRNVAPSVDSTTNVVPWLRLRVTPARAEGYLRFAKTLAYGSYPEWNFTTGAWITSGGGSGTRAVHGSEVKWVRIQRDPSLGWRMRLYSAKKFLYGNGSSLANGDTGWFNDVQDDGNPYWLAVGTPYTNAAQPCDLRLSAVWDEEEDVAATRDAAKYNQPHTDSRVKALYAETNTATDYGFGADQATGRQVGFTFAPAQTGSYQQMEFLVRQRGTNIKAYDVGVEVWETSGGFPSTLVGKSFFSSLCVEESAGLFQWQKVLFPATLQLQAGTTYAVVLTVNGAGSSTQAIDFACESVASGGNLIARTRSASAWGSWSSDATKALCHRIYSGWYPVVSRRVTLTERYSGNPIMRAGNPPSWEAQTPTHVKEYIRPNQVNRDTGSLRVVYSAMTTDVDATFNNRNIGAATGPDMTALSKVDQNPLLNFVTNTVEHQNPWIYDWTSGAMKMFVRRKWNAVIDGRQRHLVHASNAHANWSQPESSGGWSIDGIVTYPWPLMGNTDAPAVFEYEGKTYVAFYAQLDPNSANWTLARTCVAEVDPANPTVLKNGQVIHVDLTDSWDENLVNFLPEPQGFQASDGWYHAGAYQQLWNDTANGNYKFSGWVFSGADPWIYSSPYPILPCDETIELEQMGPARPSFISDTEMIYDMTHYYDKAIAPYTDFRAGLAYVNVGVITYDRRRRAALAHTLI